MEGSPPECLMCTGAPSVVIAVTHHGLRQLIIELLQRDHASWHLHALGDQSDFTAAVATVEPDLVIVDAGDFARFCRDSLRAFPRRRVIVIGPEPDAAYERAAQRAGAGAWLVRDRVGEDLSACLRRVLGCAHRPGPRSTASPATTTRRTAMTTYGNPCRPDHADQR